MIGRYICLFLVLLLFAQCTLLLDSFLKQNQSSNVGLKADDYTKDGQVDKDNDGIADRYDDTIFTFRDIENWIVMIPLTIILGIIMVWCFYFRFMKAVMARRRLIWVEVLNQKNSEMFISRYQAK